MTVLTERDLHARSTKSGVIPADEIAAIGEMLDRVPIVETLHKWQASDAAGKRPGGRPQLITHRAMLIACILIWKEHTPFHTTELGNLFWRRLDDEGRRLLGIDHVPVTGDHMAESKFWHNRADRALHRIFDLMDPAPAARQLMNAAERRYQLAERAKIDVQQRHDRLDWFVNQLLEMTLRALPADVLEAWKGDVSVDQTKIPAVSSRGRGVWKKSHGKRVGKEPDAVLMELDSDWYRHNPESRFPEKDDKDATWAYAANLAVMTRREPGVSAHPLLAVAYVLGTPLNNELPEKTIAMLASLHQRGHPAGRVTGDMEYFALQLPERLAMPARALGYRPMTDYRKGTHGVNGGVGGAVQIEGHLYCPSIPAGIRDATKLHIAGKITDEVYERRITEQRPLYRVRIHEPEDETGKFAIKCPAFGIGATVDCPLRDVHSKAAKRARPLMEPPAEKDRDRICTKTNVTVRPEPATMRYLQDVPYRSPLWRSLYGHDRSQIESFNGIIKDESKEAIEKTGRRRLRGYTAAAVSVAFALVSANLRQTQQWLRKREIAAAKKEPLKRNTKPFSPVSLKNYVPRLPMLDDDGNPYPFEQWQADRKAADELEAKRAKARELAARKRAVQRAS